MKSAREKLESLKTDKERWAWLIENQEYGFIVMLDNDDTFIYDPTDGDWSVTFDGYIGYSDGAKSLLDVVGIKWEEV